MPGNYDDIIREVLQSTSTKPTQMAGDVVPFPDLPKIMQDDAPIAPDDRIRRYPQVGPLHENNWHRQYFYPGPAPANDASIANAILRG